MSSKNIFFNSETGKFIFTDIARKKWSFTVDEMFKILQLETKPEEKTACVEGIEFEYSNEEELNNKIAMILYIKQEKAFYISEGVGIDTDEFGKVFIKNINNSITISKKILKNINDYFNILERIRQHERR